jgi:hypothetical protein
VTRGQGSLFGLVPVGIPGQEEDDGQGQNRPELAHECEKPVSISVNSQMAEATRKQKGRLIRMARFVIPAVTPDALCSHRTSQGIVCRSSGIHRSFRWKRPFYGSFYMVLRPCDLWLRAGDHHQPDRPTAQIRVPLAHSTLAHLAGQSCATKT